MDKIELLEQVDTLRKALELAMTDVERNEAVSLNEFYEETLKEHNINVMELL